MIAVLGVGRPDLQSERENPRQRLWEAGIPVLSVASGVALLSILGLLVCQNAYGSVPAAIAHLRGERVSIQPNLVDVGDFPAGETQTVQIEVMNWTEKPVRLFGGTADCSCTVLGDLPVTIPANESRSISVQLSHARKPGFFTRKAAIHLDDEGYKVVIFRLTGRIVERDE